MNRLTAILATLLGMAACSDSDPRPLPVAETTVRLEGAIGQSTRAVIGADYAEKLKVGFTRQDETAVGTGTYDAWGILEAVREGGRGNRPIVFVQPQQYPEDGRHIRLHGYYPAEGVSVNDEGTGKVTFLIDGATDVMATGCLTGNGFNPVTTCTFRHLLTQVRLVCYGDGTGDWGLIKKIEAVDVHTRQTLDFGEATPRLVDISSDGDIKNIPVQDIANLEIPTVSANESPPDAQGYLLLPVSPADGTAEHPLRLRITTTKDGRDNPVETESEVAVSVEGGFETGRSHVISLLFRGSGSIHTVFVSVEAWTEREQGEMPI